MSLLTPHLGELLDRISILSMKNEEAKLRLPQAERAHFVKEFQDLAEVLREAVGEETAKLLLYTATLGAVNGRLWELNKQARFDRGIALMDIHPLNDRRAEDVRILGSHGGGRMQPKDKVY